MFIIMNVIIICILSLVISAFLGTWIYNLVCKVLNAYKDPVEEVKVEEQKEDINVKEV